MVVHIAYICCEACWELDPLNVRIFWMLWFNMTHLNATEALQKVERKTRGISRLLGGMMMMLRLSPPPHQHHNHWFQKQTEKNKQQNKRRTCASSLCFQPIFYIFYLHLKGKMDSNYDLSQSSIGNTGWVGVFSPRLRCFKSWLPSWWRSWLPVRWCGLPALWSRADGGVGVWLVWKPGIWIWMYGIYWCWFMLNRVVSPLNWGDILGIFDTFSTWHGWCYLVYMIYIYIYI